ncbi:MAG: flavocytochrome c [Blautia sp.]|nr:flavocytochrome c [Blautia sp.]
MKAQKVLSLIMAAALTLSVSGGFSATAGEAGSFEGSAEGKNGTVSVEVSFDENGAITDIVSTHEETAGLGDVAIDTLTEEIVSGQDLGVDAIAGATVSSEALLSAVTAAVEAAGFNPEDYQGSGEDQETAPAEDLVIDTDIVVIGGGGAGMAAAASAAEAGAKVVVLDKMPTLGGNTRLGEGTYNMADPDMLESTGAKTTPDLEKEIEESIAVETDNEEYQALMDAVKADYEAWKEEGTDTLFDSANWHALQTYTGGGEIGDLALIDTYAQEARPTYDWLVDEIGVPFKTDYIFMAIGGKWQRGHQIDLIAANGKEGDNGGSVYISRLQEHAESLGAEFYTDANVQEILTNEDGRVVGCTASRSDGSTITVNASKAVILTTGGFAANPDLVYEYSNGAITTQLTSCAVSSTGDGIALAQNVGAAMVDLDQIQVHPLGDPIDDCGCVAEFVGNWLGAQYYMFVNKEGERFVKEDGTRYEMSMAELEQTDGQMWLIVDSSQIEGDDTRTEQIESLIASGHTVKGDTVEELAEKIGVDAEVLQATIDKYNEGMESGSDEFGKATSAESVIKVAPYYASLRTPTVHHTMGGVKINSEAQVLDEDGNVIPGFYAAGEVAGGIHGNNRLGGNAYPDIMSFGRIAGENAAAE